MLQMKETDKARIAMAIDTDGSIFIVRATNSYNRKSRRIYHQLRVHVFNTNYDLVAFVKDAVGYGSIIKRAAKTKKHQPLYAYSVTALKALELLKTIYPYLIVKKKQAEVAFIFGETIRDKANNKCGRNGLEQSVVDLREQCKVAVNALNGNNGGHKLRLWNNNGCELGELPAVRRDNPEPSKN